MTIIHLPEFAEWYGLGEYRPVDDEVPLHRIHWTHFDPPNAGPVEGCAGCAVGPMLRAIHQTVWVEGWLLDETWALQDGYGEPGVTPPQGWDWSGIRDSSPAAIARMYAVVTA